jgi:prepilin-type N-terminal cleavage/methylation domain-containing protein
MSKFVKKVRHGFTLVEIMIVVLIIGILLAIAVPNFIKARESSRAKACIANLKQIDSAKEQWAMDNSKANGSAVVLATDLVGATLYIKSTPKCPASGAYTVGAVGTDPECSLKANTPAHILP